jgi:LmbE family N-acetylglucosaminyl deacetylase
MIRKTVLSLFTLIFFLQLNAQAPRTYTSSEILLQLKKLNTVGSVLYIAAHPDDENTRLIAYLANEKCLRTGYLSLTRGDGGQNLIGPEQGVELGVIRTQELLAARRVDGGEQFFTRAYDFGFSKTPEETFNKWNRDSVLSDVVWVIRNFRPDIIITRFATDGSGGHGHHTASAILAEEAFDAAGDPTRFPEQLKYVEVWKPRRMFYNTVARFRDPNADMSAYIPLDVGGYNPLLGKSYGEIAAESRSMHKSQGFGSARQRGEFLEHFKPIKGDTAGLKDIFQGMDFSWKRIEGGTKIQAAITNVIRKYDIASPATSMKDFRKVMDELQKQTGKLLAYKVQLANNIMQNMNGIVIDATSSEPAITTGSRQKLTVSAIARGITPTELSQVGLDGSLVSSYVTFDTVVNKQLIANTQANYVFQSVYGKSDAISQHYNLRKPIKNNMFDIGDLDYRSAPETFVNSSGVASMKINGSILPVPFRFQYKWVDPEKGELYRPLVITPPVMINVMNDMMTFSDDKEKKLTIVLKAGKDSISGQFRVMIPEGWKMNCDEVPAGLYTYKTPEGKAYTECPFSLDKKGQEQTFHITVMPLTAARNETIRITALVNGEEYSKGIKEIKYDHIPVQTLFPAAEVKLVKLDVKKKLKRIGYIPGAGDEVQGCLTQLGYEVTTLTDDKLANENLSQYDAIVTGVRAYNTNEKLPSFKQRLMDYVAAGGNLVVQYNTNSWAGPLNSEIGPYPFKITRERITDEDAKVIFELPDHPVLNTPNKITEKDFEGWIQERSIYHANDWGNAYEAPLSMADPNEKASKGALIIGKHGKGNFIYTGLVFFRELPAGVPGAYRLMVNIIELGK